ncbi:creatinine amidohydrolase [Streptomyces abyssalis]|uniref:Creatinine amidohydrolase n=1 Tax=Streptomyces abyssalis TaxID=933944 RepID=A0A1E7JST3_9ACTN|nr:creatininase family protein [Streptomyces abyssalis]OEU91965.1 creatinine amidohydrolase [Streptomyces abyssalis]OEU93891.1 creatinine amidohydrolase [Streptomyces abyssalis]OEV31913.1 creatinine amidohydrolase [Streptomyces nanshensis]
MDTPAPAVRALPLETTGDAAERKATVALLPVGSYEQHGPYLPLSTDTLIACAVAERVAASYPVQPLPPLTVSCSQEHARWPGTVSITAGTLGAVVRDVAHSLRRSGVPGLVLVNGHGGNYVLRNVVQEATADGHRMALFPVAADWEDAAAKAGVETPARSDMHAGELETSILLHARPDCVREGYETTDWLSDDRRHLHTLGLGPYTESGVVGRPSLATARKGDDVLTALTGAFAGHLEALESL